MRKKLLSFLSTVLLLMVGTLSGWAQWNNIAQNTETDVFEIGSSAASTVYYTVNNDGTLAKQPTEDGAIGALTAKWSGTSHGYVSYANKITIPAGIFKIGLGTCQYGTGTSSVTDASSNALTVRTPEGADVTSFNTNDGTCYHQDKTTNIKYVYYQALAEQTIIIKSSNYVPFFTIESANSMPALSTKYNVTYSNSDASVAGTVPAGESVIVGSQVTIPANRTLYKDGYTLTGWTDGVNNYNVGNKITVNSDITLTPIFRPNTHNIDTRYDDVEIKWDFQRKNGAPTFNVGGNTPGIYVAQANVNGETIDVKMDYNTRSGKLANDSWTDWAQLNGGFEFYLPSVNGASVEMETYSVSTATTIDGNALTGNASKTPSVTITSNNNPITVVYGSDASYFRWISVTLPKNADDPSGKNPWDNFEDFAIDLQGNNFLTQSNDVSTVGFKKSGANIVACATDDADAIGTITGRSRGDVHGLVSFSMTVAVPGNVRITAGTCQWGGNLTIKKGATTVATVNTNNGTCFHGNTTQNRVVTYYEGEATTLTISGGNYMPFISVESVNNVPALYTLTFKNGDTTVDTKQIYQGTGAGTLPTINDLASDQYFLGWYSNASQIDTRINTATIPTGNTTYYAVIKTINTTNGMLVPEAGDAFSFIAHLEKANATATAQAPAKIFLQNGTYDLGTIINTEVRDNVHILGQSRGGVTVINHPAQAGMSSSETLNVRGSNVYMQNFTVRCDVSYPGSAASGVGTAIRTYGDRNIFYNMDMQGNQDTFNTPMGDNAVAYVKGGRIEGTVDYICGSGNIWFEGVNLYMNDRSNADVIAAPSTAASTQYGYVFNGCTIDGAAGQADKYNLARPWHNPEVSNVPAATWINTNCIIKPSAKGYTTMGTGRVRFHEFNTMDAEGTVITGHNFDGLNYAAGSDEIYLASIGNYTYANVLGGWDPEAVIASYNEVTPTINAQGYGTFSCAYPVQIAGVKAYKATINAQGDALECTEIENGLVPAGEGVLLYGEVGASVTATYVASAPAVSNNDLKATTLANGSLKDINEVGEKVLVLSGNTFVPYATGNPFVANKAYLTVAASAKPFRIVFNNQTTGISTVSAAKKVANAKFIENGRIVIIKDGAKYNVAGQVIK